MNINRILIEAYQQTYVDMFVETHVCTFVDVFFREEICQHVDMILLIETFEQIRNKVFKTYRFINQVMFIEDYHPWLLNRSKVCAHYFHITATTEKLIITLV